MTYLSVDIDFWMKHRDYANLRNFLELAKGASPNIYIVDSHEGLKAHVNKSGCINLINVDYHSDIYDIKNFDHNGEINYNCGTWVNFVNCRNKGRFTWIHPHIGGKGIDRGYCHVETRRNFRNINPFFNPSIADWFSTYKIETNNPEKHIDWGDIGAVGIAFSYAWLRSGIRDEIVKVAKEVLGKRPPVNPRALLH